MNVNPNTTIDMNDNMNTFDPSHISVGKNL
jgi:hypothetical protein